MQAVYVPTRNPVRIARAAWRLIRDLNNTQDALTVEMAFFRSRLLRRYARWEEAARELRGAAATAAAFMQRPRLGTIDLERLEGLPVGTLGNTFASHMRVRGLNPYLFDPVVDRSDGDFVMAHLLETHDLWHVVTGCDTDVDGEFELTAFYAAQTGVTSAAMLLMFGFANTTFFAPQKLRSRLEAVSRGWYLGRRAKPLFGIDWNSLWEENLQELRDRLDLHEISTELPDGQSSASSTLGSELTGTVTPEALRSPDVPAYS